MEQLVILRLHPRQQTTEEDRNTFNEVKYLITTLVEYITKGPTVLEGRELTGSPGQTCWQWPSWL